MFIRYYLELPLASDRVEAGLLSDPGAWVPGLAGEADDRGEELLSEVGLTAGPARLRKQVIVQVADATRFPSKTVLPISWRATGPDGLFPALEADIEVAPLGSQRTQLSISARYTPPLGTLGKAVDRLLLHRVAEATLRDFLERVARRIEAEAAPVLAPANGTV